MKGRDSGGVLLTPAIHSLGLFQSLTGPVAGSPRWRPPLRCGASASIARTSRRRPWPSSAAPSAADATTVAFRGFPERIELACEKATAILHAESLEVHWKDGRTLCHEGSQAGSGGADPMVFSYEAHKALITDFLDAIDQGRDPTDARRPASMC
jgi:predicted dehydrogenase